MIIWINDAFEVGKSHTCAELTRPLDNTFLFTSELIGFFIRKNLPNTSQFDDFSENPLWRRQVLENLLYCDKQSIITIVNDEIFDFIIAGLKNYSVNIHHFSLQTC